MWTWSFFQWKWEHGVHTVHTPFFEYGVYFVRVGRSTSWIRGWAESHTGWNGESGKHASKSGNYWKLVETELINNHGLNVMPRKRWAGFFFLFFFYPCVGEAAWSVCVPSRQGARCRAGAQDVGCNAAPRWSRPILGPPGRSSKAMTWAWHFTRHLFQKRKR